VAVDGQGFVYVADRYNNRIQKFDANGVFWAVCYGFFDISFSVPYGVAVDGQGNFYVADTWNRRIEKFSTGQLLLTVWGSYGTGNGQFREPNCVAVDA
jgi:tripartite motif-containing protein 71